MSSRRTLKAASAIREVVSLAILTELRDPRIQNVTVTFVEISADMRFAKIHVSIMGDAKQQSLCLHGLQNSAGFLQKRVNDRIETRYTPRLQFVLDEGVKRSFKVAEILKEVLPPATDASRDDHIDDDIDDDESFAEDFVDRLEDLEADDLETEDLADDSSDAAEPWAQREANGSNPPPSPPNHDPKST